MPRVTGRITLSCGPDLRAIGNSRQISRRNTVSLETESGEWQALSPLTIQEEVSRAPGSHHAKPTCDDAVTEKDSVVPGLISNEAHLSGSNVRVRGLGKHAARPSLRRV